MTSQVSTTTKISTLFFALLLAGHLNNLAQAAAQASQQPRYRLVDLGTFGGPASYFANGFDGILNNHGIGVGTSNTPEQDPFCFWAPNCFATHAFQVQNGVVTDLGVLPGGDSSAASWISANGLIAGFSQNGESDPLLGGFPEIRGVLWRNGEIVDLGTLEGGFESFANAVNNRGQVVGLSLNTVPDACSLLVATQTRAFLWQDGVMQDLGTLGGPGCPCRANQRSRPNRRKVLHRLDQSCNWMSNGTPVPVAERLDARSRYFGRYKRRRPFAESEGAKWWGLRTSQET